MNRNLKILLWFFAGCTISLSGQQLFDFEEDSLTGWLQLPPGRWERIASDPIVGGGSLHHAFDNPASGVDQVARNLQYPDLSDTLAVSFRVRHGYPPSSGNNWQLYFLASGYLQPEKNETIESAFIFGVNYSGYDDHLKLWHLLNGDVIEILDTGLDYQDSIGTAGEPLFRITRYPGGRWEVAWQVSGDTEALQSLGGGMEIEAQHGKFMGFRYAYSSSQDRKLWLDDISVQGRFYRDILPPRITGVRILGLNGLEIMYNEPVLRNDQIRYSWDMVEPDSLFRAPDLHRIYFSQSFPNREVQELHVSGIQDLENNAMRDTILRFRQNLTAFGDVVINEIMTDPDPPVYLPACEFVELYNRYNASVDLAGWHLYINEREYALQFATIPPGDYLILTHPDCNGSYENIEQQGILTSSTALVNGGGVLRLTDRHGRLIHYLEYAEMERYGNEKADGGWSLERVDSDNLCGGSENWHISENGKGGTPGTGNSHHHKVPDTKPPFMVDVGIPSASQVNVTFSEPILIHYADHTGFMLGDDPAIPASGPGTFAGKEIQLALDQPLDTSMLYQLTLENISDCAGNVAEDQVIPLILPSAPVSGSPVINEIMYDPAAGGNEYLELYNQDDRYYDLFDLQLELRKPGSLDAGIIPFSENSRLFFPGQHIVLCKQEYALRNEWVPGMNVMVLGLDEWRQLPDGGACIRLTNRAGKAVDQVCYHDTMHHDQLQITSGVSLERIDPGCGNGPQCWTSAASSENYGTPGRMNSQARIAEPTGQSLELTPKVFSPDGDGVDDIMRITTGNMEKGGVTDLYVTDLSGNLIRHIVGQGIPGTGDHFYWHGEDQQGKIVQPGIYVVHQRSTGNAGTRIQRKACAVIYR